MFKLRPRVRYRHIDGLGDLLLIDLTQVLLAQPDQHGGVAVLRRLELPAPERGQPLPDTITIGV
ncbi:hypothetical protein D3C71_2156810 [compost metagenome]